MFRCLELKNTVGLPFLLPFGMAALLCNVLLPPTDPQQGSHTIRAWSLRGFTILCKLRTSCVCYSSDGKANNSPVSIHLGLLLPLQDEKHACFISKTIFISFEFTGKIPIIPPHIFSHTCPASLITNILHGALFRTEKPALIHHNHTEFIVSHRAYT